MMGAEATPGSPQIDVAGLATGVSTASEQAAQKQQEGNDAKNEAAAPQPKPGQTLMQLLNKTQDGLDDRMGPLTRARELWGKAFIYAMQKARENMKEKNADPKAANEQSKGLIEKIKDFGQKLTGNNDAKEEAKAEGKDQVKAQEKEAKADERVEEKEEERVEEKEEERVEEKEEEREEEKEEERAVDALDEAGDQALDGLSDPAKAKGEEVTAAQENNAAPPEEQASAQAESKASAAPSPSP
jgi:hypothetical protein